MDAVGDSNVQFCFGFSPPIVCICILVGLLFLYFKRSIRKLSLPPSPPGWPVVGHLHLLQGPLHQAVHKLSEKYGPIFFVRLGCTPTVVVSSPDWAKEFLYTHDCSFSDRPRFEASQRLFYGSKTIVTMQHGPQWRELRKLYTVQILTVKRIEMFEEMRNREVASALHTLEQQVQKEELMLEMNKFVFTMIGNMMTSMLFSQRSFDTYASSSKNSKFKAMFLEMAVLFGAPVIGDFIPFLRWLDIPGYKKRMDRLAKQLDTFLEEVINERLQQKIDGAGCVKVKPADCLAMLVGIYKEDHGGIDTESIKSILLDLLSAGTETSITTVEWAMAELLRNPSCMVKLLHEVEAVVQTKSSVSGCKMLVGADVSKLEYLQSVIKETLRLHPPLPLVVRQMSGLLSKGKSVGGYTLPEKTRLLVNVWAMGRDEKLWEQAEIFKPERFVGSQVDVRGKDFGLLPFGSGRRGCPGMNLGLAIVGLVLGNMVQRFEWRLGDGESPGTMDMTELTSRMAPKAKPLIAIAKLRTTGC